MMKTKRCLLPVFFIVFSMIQIASLAGNENTRTRSVNQFNGIKVATGIQLYLNMSDRQSIEIIADREIYNDVITEVKDGILHIYIRKKSFFNFFNWSNKNTVKAYVSATEIKSLGASSGAGITSENTLKGNSIKLNASSGAGMKLDLVYRDVSLEGSSGSNARLSGRAKNFIVSASSGSQVDARNLEASNCEAKASSGADISLVANHEISAKSSSGGSIKYSGNPEYKNINKSSGGSVSQR